MCNLLLRKFQLIRKAWVNNNGNNHVMQQLGNASLLNITTLGAKY